MDNLECYEESTGMHVSTHTHKPSSQNLMRKTAYLVPSKVGRLVSTGIYISISLQSLPE